MRSEFAKSVSEGINSNGDFSFAEKFSGHNHRLHSGNRSCIRIMEFPCPAMLQYAALKPSPNARRKIVANGLDSQPDVSDLKPDSRTTG
jgi:hypothetical protein